MASDRMYLCNYIFPFNDQRALQVQSLSACEALFADFWSKILSEEDPSGGTSHGRTKSFLTMIRQRCFSRVEWLPKYASIVLFQKRNSLDSTVTLIGLDGWKMKVHASVVGGRERTAVANVRNPATFEVGIIETGQIEDFWKKFEHSLAQLVGRKGKQNTPSFVGTRLKATLTEMKSEDGKPRAVLTTAQGGTTDVGLHTDCILRNTSFPLVLSSFYAMISANGHEDVDELFNVCVSKYLFSFLPGLSEQLPTKYDARKIDRVVICTREIEPYLRLVRDAQFREELLQKICICRNRLSKIQINEPCYLPRESPDLNMLKSPTFPCIPKMKGMVGGQAKLLKSQEEARRNLSWSQMNEILNDCDKGSVQDAWVQIWIQNRFFWKIATQLEVKEIKQDMDSLRRRLGRFVTWIDKAIQKSKGITPIMTVGLRSYKLLAVWITYCWAHRTAVEKYNLFAKYGVALDHADLKHIVLEDKEAITAAHHVASFLQNGHHALKVFRDSKATLLLALEYAKSSSKMKWIYQSELSTAEACIDSRWKAIVKKQAKLSDLDMRLSYLEIKLDSANEQVRIQTRRTRNTASWHSSVAHRDKVQSEYNSLKSQIRCLETKPQSLVFGLPRNQENAFQWLFFLFMPKEFRDLSSLAHHCQSLLHEKCERSKQENTSIIEWFNCHKVNMAVPSAMENGSILGLQSTETQPRFHAPDIRNYTVETCVFFPDSFPLQPIWIATNPFSMEVGRDTTVFYTEPLPNRYPKVNQLQKFVSMLPTSSRENEGIATKTFRPNWLLPREYLVFSTMRAHPRTQIRKLVTTIAENALPFNNECVHVLLKQLVLQYGETKWASDLDKDWSGLSLLSFFLEKQLDLMRHSSQNVDALSLLGSISAFYGQFSEECNKCAVRFSEAARDLATQAAEEAKAVADIKFGLYQKQAQLFGCSLLCHGAGKREHKHLEEIVKLIVLFTNKMGLASVAAKGNGESMDMHGMDQAVLYVMANRIHDIKRLVKADTAILTKSLALVIENCPRNLSWQPVSFPGVPDTDTACFEAIGPEDCLYSINLLNGTVLVDGSPPGFLPGSIIKHRQYCRSFGTRNFEVVNLGFRYYSTVRPVDGNFYYEFVFDTNDRLFVVEYQGQDQQNRKLSLLEREEMDLPQILKEKYTLWYSASHDAILLRGVRFQERSVDYVITQSSMFQLPLEDKMLSLEKILHRQSQYCRFLHGETEMLRILTRFEEREFIHIGTSPDNMVLTYTLPRYAVCFRHRGQSVECPQFQGFHLSRVQHLDDTLPGLTRLLVLQNKEGRRKILIPAGEVGCGALIPCPCEWNLALPFHIYNEHSRFKSFTATDTIGRLHLASLYASNSSHIQDRRNGQPGSEIACNLLRQCWRNEPFSSSETEKLMEVSHHSQLSCVLRLLCTWLWESSNSVTFLHETRTQEERKSLLWVERDTLACDEYRQKTSCLSLSPEEELFLLNSRQLVHRCPMLEARETSVVKFVRDKERLFQKNIIGQKREIKTFPFNHATACVDVQREEFEALKVSWDLHFQQLEKSVQLNRDFRCVLDGLQQTVSDWRSKLENSLIEKLSFGDGSFEHRLQKANEEVRSPRSTDLLRVIVDPASLNDFNASLKVDSPQGRGLRVQATDWALLCVLEDKLGRIKSCLDASNGHGLLQELQCVRRWPPTVHPRWLALEVEQQIQIRPAQYQIAKQLIETPGSVVQLNMGLGKTRVIVPMIVLEWMQEECLTRLSVLASIVDEAIAFYRKVLVASLQNIKLFRLPFQRNFPLTDLEAGMLSDELLRCQKFRGFLVVTPQHRNSLLLKQHDDEGAFVEGLTYPVRDLLDESDAILHHQFQLVYALGEQIALPSGPCRWEAAGVLLNMVGNDGKEISSIFSDRTYVYQEQSPRKGCCMFPKLRILAPFFKDAGLQQQVRTAICVHLVANPPKPYDWMEHITGEEREQLTKLLWDNRLEALSVIERSKRLVQHKDEILALRGFMAYGLLFHALARRHRVHYGVDRESSKLMAVPFAASNTPKQRSEFTHPDMAILYTCLAYYSDGLSREQFRDALQALSRSGPSFQSVRYQQWVASVELGVDSDTLRDFDDILKVDSSNYIQFEQMYDTFRFSMEVIQFWMESFIFSTETYQFRKTRATSAWNLVDVNSRGFSGTDDNRRLLPQAVKQVPPRDKELHATNGRMIELILSCTKGITLLPWSRCHPLWFTVLSECENQNAGALIDVGGLMAGTTNKDVAVDFASRLAQKTKFRGVVFFNTKTRKWHVVEIETERDGPLQSSSLNASECFVYFDQSRCRGVDHKLDRSAVALVTLDPNTTKAAFLQGAARMRQLRPGGQQLILAGTSEVVSKESTVHDVMERIIRKTASSIGEAIPIYFEHGSNFFTFPTPIKMKLSLSDLYGSSETASSNMNGYLDSIFESDQCKSHDRDGKAQLLEYCKNLGEGLSAAGETLSRECERELEQEKEKEKQEEKEERDFKPYDQLWKLGNVFLQPSTIFAGDHAIPLQDFVKEKIPHDEVPSIRWSKKLFCTHNFWKTVSDEADDLSQYLRTVDGMLVVEDGRVILVSDFELNEMLPDWWSCKKPRATIKHLALNESPGWGFGQRDSAVSIDSGLLTEIKLFAGSVSYKKREWERLRKMFERVASPEQAIKRLLYSLDRISHFHGSQLETFVKWLTEERLT